MGFIKKNVRVVRREERDMLRWVAQNKERDLKSEESTVKVYLSKKRLL